MSRVTEIRHSPDGERVFVAVDGRFCCSVRSRTFPAMGLEVGTRMTCDQVKFLENYFWKLRYGTESWEREAYRLERVMAMINWADPRVVVERVGFGAGMLHFIPEHPDESGVPDLAVTAPDVGRLVMRVEVSGTERLRGEGYWVRPDKLLYARHHLDEEVWIALHYREPSERVVCVRPQLERDYEVAEMDIHGAGENYVVFSDDDVEVTNHEGFRDRLRQLVDGILGA